MAPTMQAPSHTGATAKPDPVKVSVPDSEAPEDSNEDEHEQEPMDESTRTPRRRESEASLASRGCAKRGRASGAEGQSQAASSAAAAAAKAASAQASVPALEESRSISRTMSPPERTVTCASDIPGGPEANPEPPVTDDDDPDDDMLSLFRAGSCGGENTDEAFEHFLAIAAGLVAMCGYGAALGQQPDDICNEHVEMPARREAGADPQSVSFAVAWPLTRWLDVPAEARAELEENPLNVYTVTKRKDGDTQTVIEREDRVLGLADARLCEPQCRQAMLEELTRWSDLGAIERQPLGTERNVLDSRWVLKFKGKAASAISRHG